MNDQPLDPAAIMAAQPLDPAEAGRIALRHAEDNRQGQECQAHADRGVLLTERNRLAAALAAGQQQLDVERQAFEGAMDEKDLALAAAQEREQRVLALHPVRPHPCGAMFWRDGDCPTRAALAGEGAADQPHDPSMFGAPDSSR